MWGSPWDSPAPFCYKGSPLTSLAVLLCPRVGAPCFPAHGGLITELASLGARSEAIPKPGFALLEQAQDTPGLGSLVMPLSPPDPWQKQKLSSPSPKSQAHISGGARNGAGAAVGNGSASLLTGYTLASSPDSCQQQGEQGQGEDLHVQPSVSSNKPAALAVSGPPGATCLCCLHFDMIYPPAWLSMTALDSPQGKNRPEILIKGNQ